ncbi:MAG: BMP family protein [Candidatus Bathyarchaeia archaeon]
MSERKTRTWLIVAAIIIVLIIGIGIGYLAMQLTAPPPPPPTPKVLRLAMILPGRIDDTSWNQAGYESLMRVKGKLGPEIEIAWVEGVYDPADIVPALRSYAEKGYDLIIGHGFQFAEPITKTVAPEYPKVSFLAIAGWGAGPNSHYADVRTDQTGYLFGYLAAKMTKTGKIGYIAGLEVAELARFAKGYVKGAKAVNPNIDIRVVYVGDFHDVSGAKETAISMANAGVDVIATMGDGVQLGAILGCKEKGVYIIGSATDISTLAPDLVLTSGMWYWDAVIEEWINDYKAGILGGKAYWADLKNGGLRVKLPLNPVVPEDVQKEFLELQEKIIKGEIDTGGP